MAFEKTWHKSTIPEKLMPHLEPLNEFGENLRDIEGKEPSLRRKAKAEYAYALAHALKKFVGTAECHEGMRKGSEAQRIFSADNMHNDLVASTAFSQLEIIYRMISGTSFLELQRTQGFRIPERLNLTDEEKNADDAYMRREIDGALEFIRNHEGRIDAETAGHFRKVLKEGLEKLEEGSH